jgi:hypothetical protein
VRKAIALARLALEPLAVACALAASPGCELASLRLHELQEKLPKEMLVGRMTQLLVTAVAQVRGLGHLQTFALHQLDTM